MSLNLLSNYIRYLPVDMKNWPNCIPAPEVELAVCIKVTNYLKKCAGIHDDQAIWNSIKIKELLKTTRNRKLVFFCLKGLIVFVVPLTIAVYLIGLGCALSGEGCVSEFSKARYFGILIAFNLLTIALFWAKREISRIKHETNFVDYLSPKLSARQKLLLASKIKGLKTKKSQFFTTDNYENLLNVPSMFLTAENWFLLLTENEKDRFGIWLDREYPKGKIFIEEPKTTSVHSPWDKLSDNNFRMIVSDEQRLRNFITVKKNEPLVRNQRQWILAFEILLDNHENYQLYLLNKLPNRDEFFYLFTPIFAKISEHPSKSIPDAKINEIGAKGTEKFLKGRNINIEKWL